MKVGDFVTFYATPEYRGKQPGDLVELPGFPEPVEIGLGMMSGRVVGFVLLGMPQIDGYYSPITGQDAIVCVKQTDGLCFFAEESSLTVVKGMEAQENESRRDSHKTPLGGDTEASS